MPTRTIVFDTFSTEASDKNVQGVVPGVFKKLSGIIPTPEYAGNKAYTSPGSDLLTYRGICRAPIQGATGNTSTDASFFRDSPSNSMSLILIYHEKVGNVLAWVNNGNDDMVGEQAGQRGRGISLAQEKWGGRDAIVVGAPQPTPLDDPGIDPLCPIPPSPPFWAADLIAQKPSDILISFATPLGATNYYIMISDSPTLNGSGILDDPNIYNGIADPGMPFEGWPCGASVSTHTIDSSLINGGAGIPWSGPEFTWYIQVVLRDYYGDCGDQPTSLQTVEESFTPANPPAPPYAAIVNEAAKDRLIIDFDSESDPAYPDAPHPAVAAGTIKMTIWLTTNPGDLGGTAGTPCGVKEDGSLEASCDVSSQYWLVSGDYWMVPIVDYEYAVGDGSTDLFTDSFPSFVNQAQYDGTGANSLPIEPGTITITYEVSSVTKTVTDDGAGNLVGDIGAPSTINYTTGAVSLTTDGAPDNLTPILATWERVKRFIFPPLGSSSNLPSSPVTIYSSMAAYSWDGTALHTIYGNDPFGQLNPSEGGTALNYYDTTDY